MALSPIELFRSNESSLAQILQGGSQTISGIMDKAIQIGRDMSNNQQRQESDLFAMRRNETALQQRRAENLQRGIQDTQKFARGAFENDRNFVANEEQRDIQNARANINDLFSQQMQEKNYGLSVAAGARAERQLTDQEKAREQERIRLETQRANLQALYGDAGAPATTPAVMGPPTPEAQKAQSDIDYGAEFDRRSAQGFPEATRDDTFSPFPTPPAVGSSAGVDPKKAAAARAILTDPKATAGDKSRAARMLGLTADGASGEKPVTEAEKRAAEKYELALKDRATKEIDELIEGDTSSFVSQAAVMAKRKADAATYDDETKLPSEVEIAEATQWDKNRAISERAAAAKMTLPQYLAKGPQTEAAKKARTKVWQHVNGQSGSSEAPTGKPITPEIATEFMKQANGDRAKARQLAVAAGYTL